MGIHLNKRNPIEPRNYTGHISCTCHSTEEVKEKKARYNYVFMSPIYENICQYNDYALYTPEELREAQRQRIIDNKVMALGGINADNILTIKDMNFGGAVIMSDIWNRFDERHDTDYLPVIEHFKALKQLID